jgi:hypothetical protein
MSRKVRHFWEFRRKRAEMKRRGRLVPIQNVRGNYRSDKKRRANIRKVSGNEALNCPAAAFGVFLISAILTATSNATIAIESNRAERTLSFSSNPKFCSIANNPRRRFRDHFSDARRGNLGGNSRELFR